MSYWATVEQRQPYMLPAVHAASLRWLCLVDVRAIAWWTGTATAYYGTGATCSAVGGCAKWVGLALASATKHLVWATKARLGGGCRTLGLCMAP